MNEELQMIGLKALIKQEIRDQLEEIRYQSEKEEQDDSPDYDPSEDYPEDDELEEPEEQIDTTNPEYVQAMREAREDELEGPIDKQHMKVLQNPTNPEVGKRGLEKAHLVNKQKNAELQARDKGFDDEPEKEDEDLSEYEIKDN